MRATREGGARLTVSLAECRPHPFVHSFPPVRARAQLWLCPRTRARVSTCGKCGKEASRSEVVLRHLAFLDAAVAPAAAAGALTAGAFTSVLARGCAAQSGRAVGRARAVRGGRAMHGNAGYDVTARRVRAVGVRVVALSPSRPFRTFPARSAVRSVVCEPRTDQEKGLLPSSSHIHLNFGVGCLNFLLRLSSLGPVRAPPADPPVSVVSM